MNRRTLLALTAATLVPACKTVATDVPQRAAPPPTGAASGSAAASATAPERVVEPPEPPLAWGTRPPKTGPLYPVVDGMCVHGEIWPNAGGALFSYGNGTGPWSRGGYATIARLGEDGLEVLAGPAGNGADAWKELAPVNVTGAWPSPLLLFSLDQGNGRIREWPSIWKHDAQGWALVASHREDKAPGYTSPILFAGNAIAGRRAYDESGGFDWVGTSIQTWPIEPSARPIPGLAALARKGFDVTSFAANDTTLYAIGTMTDPSGAMEPTSVVRALTDGKVTEVALPNPGDVRVIGARPSLVLLVDGTRLVRLDGSRFAPIPLRLARRQQFASGAVAPNGDVWLLTTDHVVLIARRQGAGLGEATTELRLPSPAAPRAKESVQHWPVSGGLLAGVESDDPFAIGDGGALFHFEADTWSEVPLPDPPFASSGKYLAQSIVVPAKGELYVNAGYSEKGVGWKSAERYRAVLRNKRPREVLRCNEPTGGANGGSGAGFMSFPPIATEACATPFVVLLRIAYDVTSKAPVFVYDRKTDYPAVREAVKATPALGKEVDLVELVSGNQRYLGARVPSVAAGRALATAVAKRVRSAAEVRPEVVCGAPKEERTLRVDVATGEVVTPLRAE